MYAAAQSRRGGGSVIVELIGPNGAGKESLARAIAQTGSARLVTLEDNPPIRARVALLHNPRLAPAALWVGLQRARMILGIVARRDEALARLQPTEVPTLVDEGARHRLLTRCARGLLPAVPLVFRVMRRPDKFLFVSAPIDVCVARCRRKPDDHWTHRLGDDELAGVLRRYMELAEAVVHSSGVEVVRVDTSRSLEPVTQVATSLARSP